MGLKRDVVVIRAVGLGFVVEWRIGMGEGGALGSWDGVFFFFLGERGWVGGWWLVVGG